MRSKKGSKSILKQEDGTLFSVIPVFGKSEVEDNHLPTFLLVLFVVGDGGAISK